MLCHRHFAVQAERAGNEGGMSQTESERDERQEGTRREMDNTSKQGCESGTR